MAVSQRRTSRSKRKKRNSHIVSNLKRHPATNCGKCGSIVQSHNLCLNCYHYRGEKINRFSILKLKNSNTR